MAGFNIEPEVLSVSEIYPDEQYVESEAEPVEEVYPGFKAEIIDYDILKNKPTVGGSPLQGEITNNEALFDKAPVKGSKKLVTSGAVADFGDKLKEETLQECRSLIEEECELELGETLVFKDGKLSVKTTDTVASDNTLPITSAAVAVTVGNIDAILSTI